MTHTSARRIATAVATLALLVPVGTARASVIGTESFSGSDQYSFDDCGPRVDALSSRHGRYLARSTDSGWVLSQVVTHARTTYTNPTTGAWFSIQEDFTFREVGAKQVGDGLLQVDARQAGAGFLVRDSSGTVVLRGVGLAVLRGTFDVSGPDPVFLGEETLALHGIHPTQEVTTCDLVTDLIG